MKASTYEILQKIMKTELVEVSSEVFDNVRSSEADVSILCIDDTLEYKITYYVSEGNIIGSWENFTGVCRLEESLVPKRERGWYRVQALGSYSVAYYSEETKIFQLNNGSCYRESSFDWIDDNPIKFPEE